MKRGFSRTDFQIDQKSLDALEYFEILRLLETEACSPVGKERCRQVRPQADLKEITKSLSEIAELKRIDHERGPIPSVDVQDTREALTRVHLAGTVLDPPELIAISTNTQTCQRVRSFFRAVQSNAPHLTTLIDRLTVCGEVGEEIRRCLEPDGTIRDKASPLLLRLRVRIRELRARIQREMERLLNQESFQPLLRDRIITQRNGRSVLLLKPEFRGRVKGIVHDYSHSRMSLFVEPLSVVEMNNDLNLILDEEREEEIRILERLTESVRVNRDALEQDLESLAELDTICAKMRLSGLLQAIQPEISDTGEICLLKARHPLLFDSKKEETVPIDIILEDSHPVLVVSGVNAGGKTVALKTLGLLALMFQSGMEVPVGEGSRIPTYRKIYAEIGDEQSIGDGLSTFSAHLVHMKSILQEAETGSLVLVDEIGGGTNVTEGAALAMGMIDYLKAKGSVVVVTTHLEPLKAYGYVTSGVKNAGVEFDPETLQPLYRLTYGTSAPSHAFLVAEKMGLSIDVLEKARHYQQQSKGEAGLMLQGLEQLQMGVTRERERLQELQEEAAERRDHLDESLRRLREKRDQILLRVEERGRALVKRVEKELERLARGSYRIEPGEKRPQRELREIENRFRSQVKRQRRKRSRIESLKTGEWVRIVDLNREGVVSQIQESIDSVEVVVGPFKIKTSLTNLERVSGERNGSERPSPAVPFVSASSGTLREINVIGLTVDEALPIVDKFIDRAILENLDEVTIIHGAGSGRLRNAIRNYLKDHQAVAGFGSGDAKSGGAGMTVVQLGSEEKVAVNGHSDEQPTLG